MLEDFIERNKLTAHIIPARVSNENGSVCRLFITESGKQFITINRVHNKLEMEKLQNVIKEKFCEAEDLEAEERTGYIPPYLPPISIYGVQVLLDKKAENCKSLYFFVAEEETLVIPPKEIIEMNENLLIMDITK